MTTILALAVIALFAIVCGALHTVANAGGTRAQRDMDKARKARAQRILHARAHAADAHADYMAQRSQRDRTEYPFHTA